MTGRSLIAFCLIAAAVAQVEIPLRPSRPRPPPCSVPLFVNQLSEGVQSQIQKIWADYKDGDDCHEQNKAMWKVLDNMSPEDKQLMPQQRDSADGEGVENARGKHGGGRLPPAFLNALTEDERAKVLQVIKDKALDKAAKQLQIDQLVASFSPEAQAAYQQYKQDRDAKKQEREAELQAKLAKLSPDALAAYNSIKAIKEDVTFSRDQKKENIEAFKLTLSKDILNELSTLWVRKGGPGGPPGVPVIPVGPNQPAGPDADSPPVPAGPQVPAGPEAPALPSGPNGPENPAGPTVTINGGPGEQAAGEENQQQPRPKRHSARLPGAFLDTLTADERAQLDQLLRNKMDQTAKQAEIDKLVATFSAEAQAAYDQYKQEQQQKKQDKQAKQADREAKLQEKLAALSPEAQTAFAAIKAIKDDDSLTPEEKRLRIQAYRGELNPSVVQELKTLIGDRRKSGGGRKGGKDGQQGGKKPTEVGEQEGGQQPGGEEQPAPQPTPAITDIKELIREKRGARLPSAFLNSLTTEQRTQLDAILRDRTLDKTTKEAQISQLVATLSPEAQAAYQQYLQDRATKQAEKEAAIQAQLATMSVAVQNAYGNIKAIKDNTALSQTDKKTQIDAIKAALSQEDQDALSSLFRGGRGGGGGRNGGGRGQGRRGGFGGSFGGRDF